MRPDDLRSLLRDLRSLPVPSTVDRRLHAAVMLGLGRHGSMLVEMLKRMMSDQSVPEPSEIVELVNGSGMDEMRRGLLFLVLLLEARQLPSAPMSRALLGAVDLELAS